MDNFTHLLEQLLSSDRPTRESSESALSALIHQAPDQVAQSLTLAMGNQNEHVSGLAAVLFRRKIIEESAVQHLSTEVKNSLKATLLQAPTHLTSPAQLRQLADVLVNFAEADGWAADLMRQMGQWIKEPSSALKEFTLYLFELVTDTHMDEILKRNTNAVISLLAEKMNDEDLGVQLAAVKTTASFLSILDSERDIQTHSALGPQMLAGLTRSLQQTPLPVSKMKETLCNLADLTENFPRFWKGCGEELCRVLTTLAKSAYFPKEVRSGAVEVLGTLVHKCPTLVQSSVFFTQELVVLGLTLTSELGQVTKEEWISEEEEQEMMGNEPHWLGRDMLSKLATALGQQTVLAHFQQLIPLHLRAEDWVKQHTGLLAIGLIAEGCHDAFAAGLGDILGMVLPFQTSPNPRLVWASVTTLGLLCSEFEPTLQYQHHQIVMQALLGALEHSCVKVQAQATSALINFTRGLLVDDEETACQYMQSYAQPVMERLRQLLHQGLDLNYSPLLIKVLKAVSSIASVLSVSFAQYYSLFIPGLRTLINLPTQQDIKAECIRTLGYLLYSVANAGSAYVEDTHATLVTLLQQRSSWADTDPSVLALEEMAPEFAGVLRERFVEFLPSIMPALLARATAPVAITFLDANTAEALAASESLDAIHLVMRGHGTKQLAIDAAALEGKSQACKTLHSLVSTLEHLYTPLIPATVTTLLPLLTYAYSSSVRKDSIRTLGHCMATAATEDYRQALLRQLLPELCSRLKEAAPVYLDDTRVLLKTLNQGLEAVEAPAVVGLPAALQLCQVLSETLAHVFERKITRDRELKQAEKGEDQEALEKDEETDDDILRRAMEVIGTLLKAFRRDLQQAFKQCFQSYYEALLAKACASDVETLSAVCVFDDYLEHTGDLSVLPDGRIPLLEKFLSLTRHRDASVRQSSIFGVGLIATLSPPQVFAIYSETVVQICSGLICAAEARSEAHLDVTECAIGALGKVALKHRPEAVEFWLDCLPLVGEAQEAQSVHRLFLQEFQHLPREKALRVLSSLTDLARTKPEVLDAEGSALLATISSA